MVLSCSRCRSYLTAYIHRELTPRARKQVDAHLNRCVACYAAYRAELNLSRDLEQSVGRIGLPDQARLNQIWSVIQSEIAPHTAARKAFSFDNMWNGEARYSFAVIAVMIALLIPTLLHRGGTALALPNQPTPTLTQEIAYTSAINVVVALPSATIETEQDDVVRSGVVRQSISFDSNYAPTPGATDSP